MKGYKIHPIRVNGEERWPVVEDEDACVTDPHQFFYTERQFRYVERRALELDDRVAEFENREGAVCPEDVSFEEEIERLNKKLDSCEKEMRRLRAFCGSWENLYRQACATSEFYQQELTNIQTILKEDKE